MLGESEDKTMGWMDPNREPVFLEFVDAELWQLWA